MARRRNVDKQQKAAEIPQLFLFLKELSGNPDSSFI